MPCPMMQGDAYDEHDNQKNIFHNLISLKPRGLSQEARVITINVILHL